MSNDNQPDVAANAKMCKVCGCGFEASIHSVARESHRFVAANAAPEQDAEKWFGKLLAEDYQEHYCSHTFNGKQFAVPHGLVPKLLTAFAESVAAPLRAEIAKSDAQADRNWISGAQFGYTCCQVGSETEFAAAIEARRKEIEEQPSDSLQTVGKLWYSAAARAETLEAENSTLRARIATLEEKHEGDGKFIRFYRDECIRNGMTAKVDACGWPIELINERAEAAEKRVATLREALVTCAIPLEALQMSVQWELADEVKFGIAEAVTKIRAALRDQEGQ